MDLIKTGTNSPGETGDVIRAPPFRTAAVVTIGGLLMAAMVALNLYLPFFFARQIRLPPSPGLALPALLLVCGAWYCSFVTAYFVGAASFYVRLDDDDITFRTGFEHRSLRAADIIEIRFLDSLRGWTYIVLRSASGEYTLTNLLWYDKSFAQLQDRIRAWRSARAFRFPVTTGDTYSNLTAREFWFGGRRLPRFYQSKMPLVMAGYGLGFAAAFAVAMVWPVNVPQKAASQPPTRIYSAQAQRANVRMQCRVTASGTLENCVVLSENPPGYGFGRAALRMSGQFQMRPKTRDGKSVAGATVIVPMQFRMPPNAARRTGP